MQKVRQTIKELGGTMPEDLPTPPKSIKTIRKRTEKVRKKIISFPIQLPLKTFAILAYISKKQ